MEVKKSVFLTGFMGSGKTTIGKLLAKKLTLPFVDLDQYIEKKTGRTISQLFEEQGEDWFRKTEHTCLVEILSEKKIQVVALGGGTVCYGESVSLIKKSGLLVWLQTDTATLSERLLFEIQTRPLLKGLSKDTLPEFISKKLEERNRFYAKAHVAVSNNVSVEDSLKELMAGIEKNS